MPSLSVWFVSFILGAELFAAVWALGSLALDEAAWLAGDLRVAVLCVLFGGLGGITYCLRGVYLNACVRKQWDVGWLPWYVLRPVVSLILGGVSFLFVKTGLLLLGSAQTVNGPPLGIWALAFIAGLNVDRFLAKIEEIGSTAWGVEPSRQSRSSGVSAASSNAHPSNKP
ncbi:hypothetical protein L103DPR2_01919 [Limnohabitans sp. 103DPR2]|jgi:hypothetical protein|nr:hypothetical protein L103DPR2_01919 [Limnohabitans sp. 103DPR2]